MLLNAALVVVPLAVVYVIWIRPILKARPSLAEFYDQEASYFAALRLKLAGLKQKIAGALIIGAGVAVECHDQIAPMLGGVDFTPITSRVPATVWPFVTIGAVLLLNYFRKLADKRNG